MNALESGFINTDELMRKTGGTLIRNTGKIIAAITVAASVLLTFTNVRLGSVVGNDLTGDLVMMLIAAYLMYFSLEDAGEKLGMQTKEYETAATEYEQMRLLITAEDSEALRDFCIKYSESELEYRKRAALMSAGLGENQMLKWSSGERVNAKARRVFKRVSKMRATELTPQILLSRGNTTGKSELRNPERFKILRIAISLLPMTVGMCLTVSVILTMKDGLTVEGVIEGLIKLASLPIVGFRGYSAGYAYVREHGISWLETKTRILRTFKKV